MSGPEGREGGCHYGFRVRANLPLRGGAPFQWGSGQTRLLAVSPTAAVSSELLILLTGYKRAEMEVLNGS